MPRTLAPVFVAAAGAAAAAPPWVEFGAPIITGVFLLASYLLKDWLTARRETKRENAPSDKAQLIKALEREIADARLGENDARAQRDAIAVQRDNLATQLDMAITELRALRGSKP